MRPIFKRFGRASRVEAKLDRIINLLETHMAVSADDFVQVAAAITAGVSKLSADVTAAVAEITTLVANAPPTGIDPTTLAAPLASLQAAATALAATDAALTAAPPIPTPPAPPSA